MPEDPHPLRGPIIFLIFLVIIALFLPVISGITFIGGLLLLLEIAFLFFLPGYLISYIFFQYTQSRENFHAFHKTNAITEKNRFIFSAISSSGVVLIISCYLKLRAIEIAFENFVLPVIFVIILALIILILKNKRFFAKLP